MKKTPISALVIIGLLLIFNNCKLNNSSNTTTNDTLINLGSDTLNLLWSTPQTLTTSESVKYDDKNDILFVSNVNGKPDDKDGNGFISKISLNGQIIKDQWITELNAPKGMGIFNQNLFVTDIDELVIINLETEKISQKIKIPGAQFLNDIDIDQQGNVYISDMLANKIFVYKNNNVTLWSADSLLKKPNGVYAEENFLLIGNENYVLKADYNTSEMEIFISETGPIDGLEAIGNGKYMISDWSGNIHIIEAEKPKKLLLSTQQNNINAADIEYIPNQKLLFVPTFFNNNVMAYEIKEN